MQPRQRHQYYTAVSRDAPAVITNSWNYSTTVYTVFCTKIKETPRFSILRLKKKEKHQLHIFHYKQTIFFLTKATDGKKKIFPQFFFIVYIPRETYFSCEEILTTIHRTILYLLQIRAYILFFTL